MGNYNLDWLVNGSDEVLLTVRSCASSMRHWPTVTIEDIARCSSTTTKQCEFHLKKIPEVLIMDNNRVVWTGDI